MQISTSGSKYGQTIGSVARADYCCEVRNFVAEFPADLDVEVKATLLAAVVIIHNFFTNSVKELRCC